MYVGYARLFVRIMSGPNLPARALDCGSDAQDCGTDSASQRRPWENMSPRQVTLMRHWERKWEHAQRAGTRKSPAATDFDT